MLTARGGTFDLNLSDRILLGSKLTCSLLLHMVAAVGEFDEQIVNIIFCFVGLSKNNVITNICVGLLFPPL